MEAAFTLRMETLAAVPGVLHAPPTDTAARPRDGGFEAVLSRKSGEDREKARADTEDDRSASDSPPADLEAAMGMTAAPPIVKPETPPRAFALDLTAGTEGREALGAGGRAAAGHPAELTDAADMLRSLEDAVATLRRPGDERVQATHTDLVSLAQVDLVRAHEAAALDRQARPDEPRADRETDLAEPRLDLGSHGRAHREGDVRTAGAAAADARTEATPMSMDASPSDANHGGSSSPDGSAADSGTERDARGQRPDMPGLIVHGGGAPDTQAAAASGATASPASSMLRQASELVERIASQARELRESAGGREISFEVHGEADERIRVHLAIREDRTLRVSFDTTDQRVVHALRERVEVLRGRLQECGFGATEVSFRGWDTSGASGQTPSDHRRERATHTEADDAPDLHASPPAASARAPREPVAHGHVPAGEGRLSLVA